MTDEEILTMARDKFKLAAEREEDTRREGLEDLRFARLREQWPIEIRRQRELDMRPCLTEDRLTPFIRQVVNDVRQNKPGVVVHPADDKADAETAEIINGLIRNIQATSDADVATDTAAESAVSNGFGYFRINISDDGQDLAFERTANPFTIYGDPHSEAADSNDWNDAFVVTMLPTAQFVEQYGKAEQSDWEATGYTGLHAPWREEDRIMVAEYWHREPITIQTLKLSDGSEVDVEQFDEMDALMRGVEPVGQGEIRTHKVTQYILTGAEVLETNDWPGKFIPIVPVYGDEINVEGKRYFRSLINNAKDSQRRYNYWLTAATEMIALAPKAPFIGEEGAFSVDPRWNTANNASHATLEFKKGSPEPKRQPFDGVPAGMVQAMFQAAEGMKATLGVFDASLGNRSNETSGVAIRARQREGDVSTFHFIDNLSRAIRHAGRILIDLIPKVYSKDRIIRILGEDGKPRTVKVAPGQQQQQPEQEEGDETAAVDKIYDLTAGKYDLTVKSGPAYTTLREETREELIVLIREGGEQAARILGPMYLRHSDWPGADDAADKIEQGGVDPGVQQEMDGLRQQLAENDIKAQEMALKQQELELKGFEAETDRIRAQAESTWGPGNRDQSYMREVA